MRIRRSLGLCSLLVALVSALAAAQDTRKVGITMGYPASFGVLWHASDKVAIRPELGFSGSSNQTTASPVSPTSGTIEIEGDGSSIGTGVSVLFYIGKYDRLRTYVTPRFTYSHSSSTTTSSGTSGLPPISGTQTTNSTGGSGSFGAQYAIGDRFSVYGELGFSFGHSSSTSSLSSSKGSGNSWGLRSGVGVVFYP
jgi:hypothetical protein